MILGSHSFVKWTCSFKLRKHQGYKLSHKMTKIYLRLFSLKQEFCRHKNDASLFFSPLRCYLHVFFVKFCSHDTRYDQKYTTCVSYPFFFSRGRFLEFSNSKVQLLIANIEVYQIKQVKQHRFSTTFALKYTVLVTQLN